MKANHGRIAVIATVLLLSGCGAIRYPTNYVLTFPQVQPRVEGSRAPRGPVAIRRFRCPEYLCEGRIVYRPTPEQVAFYEYHRWAMDPRDSITQLVAENLGSRSIFQSVATPEVRSQPDYLVTGSIDRLEEVDEGRDVRVVCVLSMQLVEIKSGKLLWSGTASETLATEQRNLPGLVKRLSAAVDSTVTQLVNSMATQLQSANP